MDDNALRAELIGEIPRLRRLAYRLSPPGIEPDDLLQDVLERAWRARARFHGHSALATWLYRIMTNRAADLARKRRLVRPSGEVDDPEQFEIGDALAVIERAEDAALLRCALSRLDPMDRAVLVLRDGEDWTAVEVAEGCGLSVEAVHKRLRRARLRLARELASDDLPAVPSSPGTECRRARMAASAYLDGALDQATHRAVDEHLRQCIHCPPLLQALVGVREALRSLDAPAPAGLTKAVGRAALFG